MSYFTSLVDILPSREREKLSVFQPGISDEQRRQLDLPLVIGTLNKAAAAAFAYDPAVGAMEISNSMEVSGYANMDDLQLGRLARSVAHPAMSALFMFHKPLEIASKIKFSLNAKSRAKIALMHPIVADILKFDQQTFGGDQITLSFDLTHRIVKPNRTEAKYWHTDGGLTNESRQYFIRPNQETQTEFLREAKIVQRDGHLRDSVRGITEKHKLPPQEYKKWEASLKEEGILYRPPSNSVTLATLNTFHRSGQVVAPVRSNLMRVWITPKLKK